MKEIGYDRQQQPTPKFADIYVHGPCPISLLPLLPLQVVQVADNVLKGINQNSHWLCMTDEPLGAVAHFLCATASRILLLHEFLQGRQVALRSGAAAHMRANTADNA